MHSICRHVTIELEFDLPHWSTRYFAFAKSWYPQYIDSCLASAFCTCNHICSLSHLKYHPLVRPGGFTIIQLMSEPLATNHSRILVQKVEQDILNKLNLQWMKFYSCSAEPAPKHIYNYSVFKFYKRFKYWLF